MNAKIKKECPKDIKSTMPELHQSIAQHYHERTKYNPETLASKSQQLDWTQTASAFQRVQNWL